jgi:anti-sigma factor RsiW
MTQHYTSDDFIDYLHGELPADSDARVHAHLLTCDACRALCESEAQVGDWLRSAAAAEERELPPMVKARIWEAVRERRPTFADRLGALLRPVVAVPVGAVFAALVFVAFPVLHASGIGPAPTVSAAYYLEEHAAEGLENPLADHPIGAATVTGDPAATSPTIREADAADAATLDGETGARASSR